MTDEPKEPETAPTQGDTKDEEKPFLAGTYRGQKVTWTEEEARANAQKGMDYEFKQAKLKADREALASDKEDFSRFKQWRANLASDPDRAEAVARAYQDPQSVLRPQVREEGEEAPAPHSPAHTVPAEVLELRATVQQLQGKLEGLADATTQSETEKRLGRAADGISFLSGNTDARSLTLEMAEALMVKDSEMSPEGAMAVAAEKVKKIIQAKDQETLNRKGKGDEMKTLPPDGTPVPASTAEKPKQDTRMRRQTTLAGDVKKQLLDGVLKGRFPRYG